MRSVDPADADGAAALDTISLTFDAIEQEFITLAANGTPLATRTASFDFDLQQLTAGNTDLNGDLGDTPEQQARAINLAMEQLIARCPAQYFWSYNRYKTPAGVQAPHTQPEAT